MYSIQGFKDIIGDTFSTDDIDNIQFLQSDENLDHYTIENEKFVKKTWIQRILSLFWNQDTAPIKKYVNSIFTKFHHLSQHCPENEKENLRSIYQTFAFGTAAKLDGRFFDRSIIEKSQQNFLSPKLERLRNAKGDPSFKKTKENTLEIKIAKAKLAFQLGVEPKRNARGATGSYILTDLKGKKLGIYKALLTSPMRTIVQIVEGTLSALTGLQRQSHFFRHQETIPAIYADVAASEADSHFNIHLVPGTSRITLNGKMGEFDGSFMVWKKRQIEAQDFPITQTPTQEELDKFQKLTIEDYFFGNLDRKPDNWLVRVENGRIQDISLIDNSNSFIERNPTADLRDIYARKNQYKWREHPYAEHPFTKESKALMNTYTRRAVDDYLIKLRERLLEMRLDKKQIDQFLNVNMCTHLHERAEILRSIGASTTQISPASLGMIATEEAINEWKSAHASHA